MRLPLVRRVVADGDSLMGESSLIYVIWPGDFPDFPDDGRLSARNIACREVYRLAAASADVDVREMYGRT